MNPGADQSSDVLLAGAATTAGYDALAVLYNALMTGLVLSLLARRNEAVARDFVQAHFRRQHTEKFLSGLKKLGLDGQPHAVACALYHYHSNALGGVKTEYCYESPRKAWVRYPPPRWIWRGTAACAIPHSVNIAMLHGWHAHNGVTLGNPRLGFVCTGTLTSGAPGLEGYYHEYDRVLAPEERLRFVSDERMPAVDAGQQPALDLAAWPLARRQKTHRSYAMEYVRSMVPTLMALLGREAAAREIGHAARLIGMQYRDEVLGTLGRRADDVSPSAFAHVLAALLTAQGEQVSVAAGVSAASVHMKGWKLMAGVQLDDQQRTAAFEAWNELWVGMALSHDRFMEFAAHQQGDGWGWTMRGAAR